MTDLTDWLREHCVHRDLFIGLVELSVPPEQQSGLSGSLGADSRDMQPLSSPFTLLADVVNLREIGQALASYEDLGPREFRRARFQFDTSLMAGNRQEIENSFQGFEPSAERRWWMFELSRIPSRGVEVLLFEDLALGDATQAWLTTTQQVPPPIQRLLEGFATLEDLPDAPESDLQAEFDRVSAGPDASVAVFDVGQGNCNAILNSSGVPTLYFDFGRPLSFNAHTAPAAIPKFYIGRDVPIVLSHWDFDHWGAAKRPKPIRWLNAAVSATWIAPRQYLGPMHLSLAAAIVANGRLLVWGRGGPSSIAFPNGEAVLCTGPNTLRREERNDSGLALYAIETDSISHEMADPILLPGDAEFCFIPPPASFRTVGLLGLVASHHGGAIGCAPPHPFGQQSILAMSVGANNTYHHPSPSAIQMYQQVGWSNIKETRIRPMVCRLSSCHVGGIAMSLRGGTNLPKCCVHAPYRMCTVQ